MEWSDIVDCEGDLGSVFFGQSVEVLLFLNANNVVINPPPQVYNDELGDTCKRQSLF